MQAGSLSIATTGANPSFAAAIARIPDPQPMSRGIPEPPLRSQPCQQLQTAPTRRVRARPECLARLDLDVDQARLRRRRLPGRPDVEAAGDERGPVEFAPALRPVVGDLARRDGDESVADARLEARERRQLPRGAVEHVFERLRIDLDLLDARGREDEQLGQRSFGVCSVDANGEADHAACGRSQRRSRERTLSSARRFSSVIVALSCSNSSRCSTVRFRSTCTLTTTIRSPRPPRRSIGMPRPRSSTRSPGWVPGSTVTILGAFEGLHDDLPRRVRRAAPGHRRA